MTGSRVRRVVRAALARHPIGRDELGRHQLDGVAVLTELPCPVMGSGAGFHANQAGRQLSDERQKMLT